jgi:predicted nuclease of predicted toxin-antitoxin system
MTKLYADENMPLAVIHALRGLGFDVLTVHEARQANQGIADELVLEFATRQQRAVLTFNRRDFIRLHDSQQSHAGIIVCREDRNYAQLAERIQREIVANAPVANKLIRVNRL